ncbi:MAG TPA: HTTM domain-containing protein [Armatimonadaceae bacterium]|nr:HTTM domain-containing protein [Armatimonadaceae bacterium]
MTTAKGPTTTFLAQAARALHATFLRRPRHRIGAAVARIGYGLWLLALYLQSSGIREWVWGDAGPFPHPLFLRYANLADEFSLLTYSASPWLLNALWAAGVAAALLMTVGLFTRASMLASTILVWSFHARNPYILDGGDNVGRIVLIFLLFMDCSAYLSVDAWRGGGRRRVLSPLGNLLHNVALYTVTLQFCVLYLSSSLNKVTGPLWQNGTALYYVLRTGQYSNPLLGPLLTKSYAFITLATYATIAVQLSFPFLVWSRRFRVPIVLAVIGMHLGIAVCMGLVHFSHAMISSLLLFVPDETYRALAARLGRRQTRSAAGRSPRHSRSNGNPEPSSGANAEPTR